MNAADFIEALFSSKTRIRVLRALLRYREVNITRLSRELGVNHKIIEQHLEVLKNLGIAEEKRFGRVRIIRIAEGDPRVLIIEKFFEELERVISKGITREG